MSVNSLMQRASAVAIASAAFAATIHGASAQTILANNNGVVRDSLCVGFDCPNTINFGFDTLRLMENNLRIHFDDTSSTGSFPRNDWRIVVNDSANGGASFFGIEDSTAARRIFSVTAGAPANSLFVSSTGNIGIGTSTPVLDIHANTSDTPAIRLEQNNSGGFTAQTWDVAGNEANFFVRDVTNGSRLSFRIRPGAPTSSIDIASDGDVGIGDASPDAMLDVVLAGAGAAEVLRLENTGGNVIVSSAAPAGSWEQIWGGNAKIRAAGGADLFTLSTTGDLTIAGEITTSGTCSVGCDRVFSDDYDLPSIGEHASLMYEAGYLPAVGPTVEGTPMNVTRKVEGILNELEKAHIYIHQLEAAQRKRDAQIALLEERLSKLETSR